MILFWLSRKKFTYEFVLSSGFRIKGPRGRSKYVVVKTYTFDDLKFLNTFDRNKKLFILDDYNIFENIYLSGQFMIQCVQVDKNKIRWWG